MTLIKPNTFVAGQKAKASEVNENFDAVYSQVNTNMTDITSLQDSVSDLDLNKADINGDSGERFLVAEPINNYDSVNKSYLGKYTTNSQQYIDGLRLSKSTDNTILVSAGSCFDSTIVKLLQLTSNTSKQNATQSASTTYYVYIIAKTSTTIFGTEIDLLISTSSSNPPLPTDYIYYRQIGTYVTDSNNKISYTTSINPTSYSEQDLINANIPDYTNITSGTNNTTYQASDNGELIVYGSQNTSTGYISMGSTNTLDGNNNLSIILYQGATNTGTIGTVSTTFTIPKGYYYRANLYATATTIFVPFKGV